MAPIGRGTGLGGCVVGDWVVGDCVCVCVRQEKSLTSNPLSCTTVTRDGFGDEAKLVMQQSLPGLPTVQFCEQPNGGRWETEEVGHG